MSWNIYYEYSIHSYNDSYYSSSNSRRKDYYGSADDGRGGAGPRNTHFSSQKDNFGRDRHDGSYKTSQRERRAFNLDLSFSRYYSSVSYSYKDMPYSTLFLRMDGYCGSSGYGGGGIGPRTTPFSSHNFSLYLSG